MEGCHPQLSDLLCHGALAELVLLAHRSQAVVFLNQQYQGMGMHGAVSFDDLQGPAQCRFVLHQQRERSQVRQVAISGHAQAEIRDACCCSRILQQHHQRQGRDAPVRLVKAGGVDTDLLQEPSRVQPQRAGDFGKTGEACTADQVGHGQRCSCNKMSNKCNIRLTLW